jgi:hypothetical protein
VDVTRQPFRSLLLADFHVFSHVSHSSDADKQLTGQSLSARLDIYVASGVISGK